MAGTVAGRAAVAGRTSKAGIGLDKATGGLNKAAKQQMYLIHQRARRMAEAQSQEELDQLAEELAELQQKEASVLESLRKAKSNKTKEEPEKAKEKPEERQPKPYMGKNKATPWTERASLQTSGKAFAWLGFNRAH